MFINLNITFFREGLFRAVENKLHWGPHLNDYFLLPHYLFYTGQIRLKKQEQNPTLELLDGDDRESNKYTTEIIFFYK